jgi:hypothetical protein
MKEQATMGDNSNRNGIKDLIHRQGVPPVPTAAPLVTEVRTDGGFVIPPHPKRPDFSPGAILIEWTYGLPLDQVEPFNRFLEKNEAFIAASCKKLMKDVAYLGTYLTAGFGDVRYKTIWAYDSPAAFEAWDDVLQKRSRFGTALTQLRSYWARDPGRSEHCYVEASLLSDLDENARHKAFLQFTIAAAKVKPR